MKSKAYTYTIPFITFVVTVCSPSLLLGEVSLPPVLGNHMVLQRGEPVPIWGLADPGEEVSVVFGGASASSKADADGKWQVNLPSMKANAKGAKLAVKGSNEIVLEDVLVGEVWLCSGQSNMEWTVSRSMNAKQEIAAADHPLIRHIKVNHRPSGQGRRGGTVHECCCLSAVLQSF